MANPEPLAAFFDLFLMGDVETCIPPFMERYLMVRDEGRPKAIEGLAPGSGYTTRPASMSPIKRMELSRPSSLPLIRVEIERIPGRKARELGHSDERDRVRRHAARGGEPGVPVPVRLLPRWQYIPFHLG